MQTRTLLLAVLFLAITMSFTGCQKTKKTPQPDMFEEIDKMPGLLETSTMTTEGEIRGPEFVHQENILPIYFDFDRYNLSDAVRKTLQENAEILKSHKEWAILVEGHCDERGTIEYNLALGQKRAKEVRDYYVRLGIPEAALGTISYGEEKPLCTKQTEGCWAKNRRAETKVRLK
jgi:peptidoglycan-associated lipoprotein